MTLDGFRPPDVKERAVLLLTLFAFYVQINVAEFDADM